MPRRTKLSAPFIEHVKNTSLSPALLARYYGLDSRAVSELTIELEKSVKLKKAWAKVLRELQEK